LINVLEQRRSVTAKLSHGDGELTRAFLTVCDELVEDPVAPLLAIECSLRLGGPQQLLSFGVWVDGPAARTLERQASSSTSGVSLEPSTFNALSILFVVWAWLTFAADLGRPDASQ